MPNLEKATLQEVSADEAATPRGQPIAVQFNPTSLKLKLQNSTEGGRSRGRQQRQYNGQSSTTLSMDLHFDTADEGSTESPRSVRERTAIVERFVLPSTDNNGTPPKVRFHWGNLVFDGVVEGLDIDFDHFTPSGIPLRAKLGLTIKEQDPKYQYLQVGPAANRQSGAPSPGENPSAPGGAGQSPDASSPGDQSALAIEGESPADFMARMGLDPAAWRGLQADLSAGLTLEAGLEVGFNASLGLSLGVGLSVGVQAGLDASLEASLGLEAKAGITGSTTASFGASVNPELAAGFALSAAGGVSAAVNTLERTRTTEATASTLKAFGPVAPVAKVASTGAPSASASANAAVGAATSGLPAQSRPPLARPQSEVTSTRAESRATRLTSSARLGIDTRASSYGFGVPLKPRARVLSEDLSSSWLVRPSPTRPAWEATGSSTAPVSASRRRQDECCTPCAASRRGSRS